MIIPAVTYRTVQMLGEDRTKQHNRSEQLPDNTCHFQQFRYTGPYGEKVYSGGLITHQYRDFCGGMHVRSGFLHSSSDSPWGYMRRAESTLREAKPFIANLNEVLDKGSINVEEATKVMSRCLAGSVLSDMYYGAKRGLHWADKSEGTLTDIMDELTEVSEVYTRAFRVPADVYLRKTDMAGTPVEKIRTYGVSEVVGVNQVEVYGTEAFHNHNSGNHVCMYNAVVHFDEMRDECDDECPDCGYYNDSDSRECDNCGESLGSIRSNERPDQAPPRAFVTGPQHPEWWKVAPPGQWGIG